MPHSIPKPAIEVSISVCWEGGDRTFTMALTHEAILASRPNDTLLATRLRETVRVPFEHWRKLDIKLVHLWSSGQRQEIYSHTNTSDNTTTQEEVIELLSWWQQYACIQPRSIRIELTLIIETSGVPLLPPRAKALTSSFRGALPVTGQRLSPTPTSPLRPAPDLESDTIFKTIVYDSPIGVDEDEDLVPQAHVVFDRTEGTWNRIVFSRPSSDS
jgi:hypothetical protein